MIRENPWPNFFFVPLAIPQRPFVVEISWSPEATVRRLRPVLLLLGIPFLCLAQTDSRIPAEVRYKSGYINPVPKPPDFTSAMLWGIVIADNRIPGYQHAPSFCALARARIASGISGAPRPGLAVRRGI